MSGLRFQSFLLRPEIRGVREIALIGALAGMFVFGTQAAAVRQQPLRHELDALGYVLLVTAACILAGRARRPRLTLAAVLILVGTYLLIGYPYGPVWLAVSVAVFAVVERSPTQQAPWVTLMALIAVALPQLWWVNPANPVADTAVLLAESAGLVVPPALLAMIRQWIHQARAAEQREALAEERLALAREVHDIVAHNLSMASIQAGAALRVFDRDPAQAKAALELIRRTNQESLADLRRTIGVLRTPPSPGLAQLDALAETVRAAGIVVALRTEGTPTPVPTLVELAVYRIVQESLTNVVRHAGATQATVALRYRATELTVEIRDDGRGPAAANPPGTGLTGMRERAQAAGGQLSWGPAPGAGFQVRAQLPLAAGCR